MTSFYLVIRKNPISKYSQAHSEVLGAGTSTYESGRYNLTHNGEVQFLPNVRSLAMGV